MACGYLQLLADDFTTRKEYKEKQLNSLGLGRHWRGSLALRQDRMRAALWKSHPDRAGHTAHSAGQQNLPQMDVFWVGQELVSFGTIVFSWVRDQSNLLGVAPWNPHTGDAHPCPEGPSGDHIQWWQPLRLKVAPRNLSAGWRTPLPHTGGDFPRVFLRCCSLPYTTLPMVLVQTGNNTLIS